MNAAAFGLLTALVTVAVTLMVTPIVDSVRFTVIHECAPVQGTGFTIWR